MLFYCRDYGLDKSAIKIGLATYDNLIHFYRLGDTGNPGMLIVNDMQDVFAPLADGFLVEFDQAEASLVRYRFSYFKIFLLIYFIIDNCFKVC